MIESAKASCQVLEGVGDDGWTKQHNALFAEFSDRMPHGIRWELRGVEIDSSKPIHLNVKEGRGNKGVDASDVIARFRSSRLNLVNRTSCKCDLDQFSSSGQFSKDSL